MDWDENTASDPSPRPDHLGSPLNIPDEQAVQSFWTVGSRHRTVVTWWLLKSYRWVDVTPGFDHAKPDRNALAIEIFWHYMAQLEALEMTYFALRDKTRDPGRSILDIYAKTTIREKFDESDYSAGRIIADLDKMTPSDFERELGLSYEGMRLACCGRSAATPHMSRAEYETTVRYEIEWLKAVIGTKNQRQLHRAYLMLKHGFLVLAHPERDDVYAVIETVSEAPDSSSVETLELNTSEDFVLNIAREVHVIGKMITRLWGMYLGRSPCERCERCSCNEEADDWMITSTARELPAPAAPENMPNPPTGNATLA